MSLSRERRAGCTKYRCTCSGSQSRAARLDLWSKAEGGWLIWDVLDKSKRKFWKVLCNLVSILHATDITQPLQPHSMVRCASKSSLVDHQHQTAFVLVCTTVRQDGSFFRCFIRTSSTQASASRAAVVYPVSRTKGKSRGRRRRRRT